MKDFVLIGRSRGVPIFLQQTTTDTEQVSLKLVIFAGANDDELAGGHGIMHWFEHVPFKGTAKFPGGEPEIFGPFERHGGEINAFTNNQCTCYEAFVPVVMWRQALELLVDLLAQPLLTEAGINAEREVIYNEIASARADIGHFIWQEIPSQLWPSHPFGHSVLGNAKTLKQINPERLRQAHRLCYDISRCALIVSGPLTPSDLLQVTDRHFRNIPDHGLSGREAPADWGELPPIDLGATEIKTSFEPSLVFRCWPIPANPRHQIFDQCWYWQRIRRACNCGGLNSPLLRILRRERQLVYGAGAGVIMSANNGGIFYLVARTKDRANIPAIITGFSDVIADQQQTRAADWHDYVADNIAGERVMEVSNPDIDGRAFLSRIMTGVLVPTDQVWYQRQIEIPHTAILNQLKRLTPESSRTLIFQGKD